MNHFSKKDMIVLVKTIPRALIVRSSFYRLWKLQQKRGEEAFYVAQLIENTVYTRHWAEDLSPNNYSSKLSSKNLYSETWKLKILTSYEY